VIIIGELINCARKTVLSAVENRDDNFVADLAEKQAEAGANYIGVNAGIPENEPETMTWLVEVVQESISLPLCLDSESALAQSRGLEVYDWERGKPILNSISLEPSRLSAGLEVIEKWSPRVVGLCVKKGVVKGGVQSKVELAQSLVDHLKRAGLEKEDIFLDPCILPVAIDESHGPELADTVNAIHKKLPGVHVVGGVSNVSFGLPSRKWLNRAYTVILMARGLDTVICDPTDQALMTLIQSSETLLGNDVECEAFLEAFRGGMFSNV
jgi:5-methyltetrahydrofolate--homocysteine methyltransferase